MLMCVNWSRLYLVLQSADHQVEAVKLVTNKLNIIKYKMRQNAEGQSIFFL